MIVDEKKICFIICSNNDMYLEECLFYIEQLSVPIGYVVDIISIQDAKSMTAAYNEAMEASNAKYKIYLHQDVFILYKDFLKSLIMIFTNDKKIGMIGMVGAAKMPACGIMWYSDRAGGLHNKNYSVEQRKKYIYSLEDGYHTVDVIDGLLMATAYDIPWRSDIFDDWHYYDVSQSYEFYREGYKVVVPEQRVPWCYHDGKIMNLKKYDHYRNIGMQEYKEFFNLERYQIKKITNTKENDTTIKVIMVANNQYSEVRKTLDSINKYSRIKHKEILIIDNGSEDELRHWLKEQDNYPYVICNEILEGYGSILVKVIEQFDLDNEILLIKPGILILSNTIELLSKTLRNSKDVVSVSALTDKKKIEENAEDILYRIMDIRYDISLVSSKFLKELDQETLKELKCPKNVQRYLSFYSIKKDYIYYEIQKKLFEGSLSKDNENRYKEVFEEEQELGILKDIFGLNYFNMCPNSLLIEMIKRDRLDKISVLEIGCDCGANLLEIKNQYPNAEVYGLEISKESVEIAKHIANVVEGNIEDKNIGFGNKNFDYIIFGDVLEHLRDPESTIRYCKERLKKDGKILACVPNLMHYSIMKDLLNGNFAYTDQGLLDRTHIHLFTYNEIVKLFMNAGYKIEDILYIRKENGISTGDKEFVSTLLNLSNEVQEFMYLAYQYIVIASKK